MWIEEKTWKKIKIRMPNKSTRSCIPAIKEFKRRTKGKVIMAISKELKGVKVREVNKETMEIGITYNKNKWKIVTLYSQNIEKTLDSLLEKIEEDKEGYLVLGRDFNARTGDEEGPIRLGKEGRRGGKEVKRW